MTQTDEIAVALNAWAPGLAECLTSLAYLGSESSIRKWRPNSLDLSQWTALINSDGHMTAAELWRSVLKDRKCLPAPALLLIVEHLRRQPADARSSLDKLKLEFSKTLANAVFRAADALYEDAKRSFAGDEIDIAI
ncbi:hypothetical protein [Aeromonas caviae]|uniref:hypothetical protein n=1 Tax=Aeromonas caviae TaxID=648 RepID=UPI00100C364A|nr:hypothetical protein [Aeromonas caviae]MDX7647547.1 hypothetical protein [Aeromonas caviae]